MTLVKLDSIQILTRACTGTKPVQDGVVSGWIWWTERRGRYPSRTSGLRWYVSMTDDDVSTDTVNSSYNLPTLDCRGWPPNETFAVDTARQELRTILFDEGWHRVLRRRCRRIPQTGLDNVGASVKCCGCAKCVANQKARQGKSQADRAARLLCIISIQWRSVGIRCLPLVLNVLQQIDK
jgi:hypothetical protein